MAAAQYEVNARSAVGIHMLMRLRRKSTAHAVLRLASEGRREIFD
jgi:hypothetical protein